MVSRVLEANVRSMCSLSIELGLKVGGLVSGTRPGSTGLSQYLRWCTGHMINFDRCLRCSEIRACLSCIVVLFGLEWVCRRFAFVGAAHEC